MASSRSVRPDPPSSRLIYAMALDQGILHPRTIPARRADLLRPVHPGKLRRPFLRSIPAEEALIRSRNIPAVWVSMQLRQPNLYQFLQSAGISRLKPESYYGLALALGGAKSPWRNSRDSTQCW